MNDNNFTGISNLKFFDKINNLQIVSFHDKFRDNSFFLILYHGLINGERSRRTIERWSDRSKTDLQDEGQEKPLTTEVQVDEINLYEVKWPRRKDERDRDMRR